MQHATTFSKTKKRVAGLAVAGLLVAGMAGTGAFSTLSTVLSGNQFSADVPATDAPDPEGALLKVDGQPVVHTFDTTKLNDMAVGSWTLTNSGPTATTWNGKLEVTSVSNSLAQNLEVSYGVGDSAGTVWYDAGTVAAPLSVADALGAQSVDIAGKEIVPIQVRIVLPNPALLEGEPETTLSVDANFTVEYLSGNAAS